MNGIEEDKSKGSAVRSPVGSRRPVRLRGYDYGSRGTYFLTFCVKGLDCVLCKPSGELLPDGEVTERAIRDIPEVYKSVLLKNYVIMPNHVHLMLAMPGVDGMGSARRSLTVSKVIEQTKGCVTKRLGRRIWETSFYDHIIRDRGDYEVYMEYMAYELLTWERDMYYRA